ncbi:MAG: peptidase S16 [Alphaproteobacteria bacterium]|nr:peptidase S16 [Alphaproteobacteria bacterium]
MSDVDPRFDQLPRTIPIFPLTGVLLLPRGRLPLNIFEPRYLAMLRDAMGGERAIGMVQPTRPGSDMAAKPEVYRVGCVGKVVEFNETQDGRFAIALTGLCRFEIVEELTVATPYRQVVAAYARFRADMQPGLGPPGERSRMLRIVRRYFEARGIGLDWKAVERAPSDALVDALAMMCPFSPGEKQLLLEADRGERRTRALLSLMEMASLAYVGGAAPDKALQ